MSKFVDAFMWICLGMALLLGFDYIVVGTVAHVTSGLFDKVAAVIP